MPIDERQVIRILLDELGQPPRPISAIGDDVAVLPTRPGRLVIKSDMLVRQTDVPPGMTLAQAGRKAVVMCVSDFAAKGIQPTGALISLGLPKGLGVADIRHLARGLRHAAQEFGFPVVGGDTNEAADLIVDCVLVGFGRKIVPRSGARSGDIVAVSGPFGYSAAGLRLLLGEPGPKSRFRRAAISAVLEPRAALALGIAMRAAGLPSAAIDSSDGLAWSLYELAEQSDVAIVLESLPVAPGVAGFARARGIRIEELVLYGGEEYEIVATFPAGNFAEAKALARQHRKALQQIGRVEDGSPVVWRETGRRRNRIERRGWVHLK